MFGSLSTKIIVVVSAIGMGGLLIDSWADYRVELAVLEKTVEFKARQDEILRELEVERERLRAHYVGKLQEQRQVLVQKEEQISAIEELIAEATKSDQDVSSSVLLKNTFRGLLEEIEE